MVEQPPPPVAAEPDGSPLTHAARSSSEPAPRTTGAALGLAMPHVATLQPIGGFYLLILGVSFLLLPQGRLGSLLDPIWLPAALFVLSGLAHLWLSVVDLPRRLTIAVAVLAALPPLGVALLYLYLGTLPGFATLGLLALGLLLAPWTPPLELHGPWRPDALGLAFGGSVLVQGLDVLLNPGAPGNLAVLLNLPVLPLGLLMAAGGCAVVAVQLVAATPPWLRWLAHGVCGLTLLGVQGLVALAIDPLYWLLGAAASLRGLAILLLPWLGQRLRRADRRAFRPRVALALLTAAIVPVSVALPLLISSLEPATDALTRARQLAFAVAVVVMIAATVVGWFMAGGLTVQLRRLMGGVNLIAEGRSSTSLPRQGATEVVALSHAVSAMARTLEARAEERSLLLEQEQQARQAAEAATERTLRLQALTAALGTALTPLQVAQIALRQGLEVLGASAGMVVQRSEAGDTLRVLYGVGYPGEVLAQWGEFPLAGQTPFGEAIRTGRPVIVESRGAALARFPALAELTQLLGEGTTTAFPLTVRGEAIGGLGLSFAQRQAFTSDTLAFITNLVDQCAQAMERARLYEAERQARATAQEAVRARDAFLSVAAHELRTPLTSLLGNAQLVARRMARAEMSLERDQRAITGMVEQAKRLNRMIDALLDVSHLESGQFQLTMAPLDLVGLVRAVSDELEPVLDSHRLRCELPDAPLMVFGDELRLRQVLENLLGNAVKYSPPGSTVRLGVEGEAGQVAVFVSDQGIGIPAAALPNLFRRFFRAENAERRKISGIGVGLYVVNEIVALHGGTIEVRSEEGHGSTFVVRLPPLVDGQGGERRPEMV